MMANRMLAGMVSLLTAAAALIAPQAAAAGDAPAPVVIILDASGSMVREVSNGQTRMDVAKQATIQTLKALPAGTPVGLLVFGTGTSNQDADQITGCSDVTTLAPLNPVDANALQAKVDAIHESGFTPISEALRTAADMLPSDSAGSIVLVSDGVDTCAPPSSCEVASELHRGNPLLTINVVAFGVDEDEEAQQQMTCIGGVGGGTSVSASDPAQLTSRLRAASDPHAAETGLTARGSHGVLVGMSIAEVRAAVDGAIVGEPKTVGGVITILIDCGWGTVEVRNGRVYSIQLNDEKAATAEGVAPGDPLSTADAVYGAAVTPDVEVENTRVYRAQSGGTSGYRVVFDPKSSTIRYIVVCRCVGVSASSPVSDWEIDYDGVGPLTLGMSEDEVRGIVPQLGATENGYALLADGAGSSWLTARFSSDGELFELTVGHDALDWQYADEPALPGADYPSARGIRLGESIATATNAFPGGSYSMVMLANWFSYASMNRDGRVLRFTASQESTQSTEISYSSSNVDMIRALSLGSITLTDFPAMLEAGERTGY